METILGLLGVAVYIVAVLALAAGVTFLVVKLSPAKDRPKDAKT
jgi:predicted lysophospholipase L1 biosynthesis ABC-type transport system permease subunit